MFITVTKSDFIDAFAAHGSLSQFEFDGTAALFEYLDDIESQGGEPFELDVIALCCDFTRYESIAEYNEAYSTNYDSAADMDDCNGMLACIINDSAFICYAH